MFDPADASQGKFNGYGPSGLPDARDQAVGDLVGRLMVAGPEAVAAVLSIVTDKARQVLRSYAERMASLAVRRRERELLLRAVVALVLGGLDENRLESLIVMAPIQDSAERLGLDLPELFESASNVVGHPGTVNLMLWLTRRPEDRSLESMGFVVGEDVDGFRYKLDW